MYRGQLSVKTIIILFEASHAIASHSHKINSDSDLRMKLQDLNSMTQLQDPPLLRLENDSYQICLSLLQNILLDAPIDGDPEIEAHLTELCKEVLQIYLNAAKSWQPVHASSSAQPKPHWLIPLGSGKRRELAARAPMVVSTLQTITGLADSTYERSLKIFFPLLTELIRCEHGTNEVQVALSDILSSWVGPILLQSS